MGSICNSQLYSNYVYFVYIFGKYLTFFIFHDDDDDVSDNDYGGDDDANDPAALAQLKHRSCSRAWLLSAATNFDRFLSKVQCRLVMMMTIN